MSDHNADLAKKIWQKQDPLFTELYKTGAAGFFGKNGNLAKDFVLKDRSVRCMDEGTPTGVHLAGSGILMGEEKAAAALKIAECDGVYSHAECGAAGIYINRVAGRHSDHCHLGGPVVAGAGQGQREGQGD